MPYTALAFTLVALTALLTGCPQRAPIVPDKISLEPHASGDSQCGMYGDTLAKPFRVLVEGPHQPGLLGGKGGRHPAPGVDVVFQVEDPASGAVLSKNGEPEITVKTDTAGIASALLRLGDQPGDATVLATVETPKGPESARLRAISGVEKTRNELEGPTGATLKDVGLVLYDAPNKPAVGVTVYFHVEGAHHKSSSKPTMVLTDQEGRAVTAWTLGQATQQYFLDAEIQDDRADVPEARRFHGRHIRFEAMAVGTGQMLLTLVGGLAVFILGMKLMSAGLQRMADRRLKAILNSMTRNRVFAVGIGALITAMIQSSSATTVMVVGFINAGLINLAQATGVVFGANIGTTITAQIIAFKLNALAYPAIALGLILSSVGRKQGVRAFGESVLGFGLLFLGMTTMSDILKPLRYSPEFVSWFQLFDCTPVHGVVPWWPAFMCILVGTGATVIVQSSSATVGLVMALAGQGLISFYAAVPLVLGDNIGTTITAQFAALGANRNAKRAAIAHTMFNMVGALYMYLLLFLPLWGGQPVFLGFINAITPGEVFAAIPENLPRHIANAHTAFNVFNCLLFIPFIGAMVRLCERIIPLASTDEEQVLLYLEPHLVRTPALALNLAVKEVAYMLRRAQKSIEEGCEYFHGGPRELEEKIRKREKVIDRLQNKITAYLVDLSRETLSPAEAALIPKLIHAVNDAERIGDHSEDLVELAHLKQEHDVTFSPTAEEDLHKLEQLVSEQFEAARRALVDGDLEESKRVKRNEKQITEVMARISDDHIGRLESGACTIQNGVVFLDYIAHLERTGDHLVNIAKRAKKIIRVTE